MNKMQTTFLKQQFLATASVYRNPFNGNPMPTGIWRGVMDDAYRLMAKANKSSYIILHEKIRAK
jgi:hypothetical protein